MIKYPAKFYQSLPANYDGHFDWDFLLPAFEGTNIQPMDIDAIIERNKKFLIFETKAPGREIPQGQIITLNNLIKLGSGNIHLIIIYGKSPNEIESMEEWYYDKGIIKKTTPIYCDSEYILDRTKTWFKWANK